MFTIMALPSGTPPIYYHGFNFWVNFATIACFVITGILLLARKREDLVTSRHLKIGYAMFMFFFAACRTFFIMAVWLPDESWNANSYNFFVVNGYLVSTIGVTSVIFVVEKYLTTKTHRLFTVLGIIAISYYTFTVLAMLSSSSISQFLGQGLALLLSDIFTPVLESIIVILYAYLVVKTTLRRIAILTLVAIALMGFGSILDGQFIVVDAAKAFPDQAMLDTFYAIPPAMMLVGVLIFFKSSSSIQPALTDFYTNKHMCIVHKGEIKGKMFICSTCSAFYCTKCMEAIVQQENTCWNCGAMLDDTVRVNIQLRAGEPLFVKFQGIKDKLKIEVENEVNVFEQILDFVNKNISEHLEMNNEPLIEPENEYGKKMKK